MGANTSVAMRNALAQTYGTNAAFGAVYTTAAGTAQGTEPTGGSPAYARKSLAWGAPGNGAVSVAPVFDIPSGTTIVAAGVHTAVTVGTYHDGAAVTSQAFASQGTYTVTYTFTQT